LVRKYYLDGLKSIIKRLPQAEIIQLDALQMPFISEFDAIGAFDVIEHIQEDEKVIQNVHMALKPDGFFLITVPQHRFLWSYTDDFARHKRRYTRNELKSKLSRNKFRICFISSFVFTPFVFVLISRLIKKNKSMEKVTQKDIESEFLIPEWLNKLFYLLMMVDYHLIRAGCSLPFGSSLAVVAKKI
jgi:SAM-dependent methyltransferase